MAKLSSLLGGVVLAAIMTPSAVVRAEATDPKPITFEQAERIALARVPGGTIVEIERERHGGHVVFDVEVRAKDGREHDLVIDGRDGRVLSDEVDD